MGSYFLSHLHALGGGVVGYLVPFLFVLSLVVFFHELGHFLVARWCGVRILVFSIGFGPELVGFNDRYGTRWKIAAIPLGGYVKFFGDENAASVPDTERLAGMDAGERVAKLRVSAGRQARGHRGRRAAGQFPFGHSDFCRHLHVLRQAVHDRPRRHGAARQRRRRGRLSARRPGGGDQRRAPSATSPTCSASSARAPASRSTSRSIATARQVVLKATPALKEIKDNFGNVHRIGVLGISRSMAPDDVKYQPVSPPQAVWLGVQETWFVVDRTLSYIGGVVVGREAADQLGGPIRIAQMSGQVATAWLRRARPSRCGAVGFDRAAQPVPDPAARWRSPFVLCDRGVARPAAVGARPGGRLPHRPRNRLDVDDICNFQRHSSFGDLLRWPVGTYSRGRDRAWGLLYKGVGTWQKYAQN